MQVSDLIKTYDRDFSHNFEQRIETAIPYIFDFAMNVVPFDNERVEETKRKTPEELAEMAATYKHEVCKAILKKYWRYDLNAETIPDWKRRLSYLLDVALVEANNKWQILNDKFEWRTFYDYDIHLEETRDGTNLSESNGEFENTSESDATTSASSLAGDYPNAGLDAFATNETNDNQTSNGSETNNGATSDTTNGETHEETHRREYRIGATGQTPMDIQKKALDLTEYMNILDDINTAVRPAFIYTITLGGDFTL